MFAGSVSTLVASHLSSLRAKLEGGGGKLQEQSSQ